MERSSEEKIPVTIILMLVNVVLLFVCEAKGGSESSEVLYRMGAMYVPDILEGEWYRLFASMFLHFGFVHLMNNMVSLFVLGSFLENRIGRLRYLAVYLGGGLAGNLLGLLIESVTKDYSLSAGASGCIFALMGAMIAMALFRRDLRAGIPRSRLLFGVVLSFLPGVYTRNISLSAHAGGLLGGIVIMSLLLPTVGKGRRKGELYA